MTQLLTAEQAAARLSMSERTLRKIRQAGGISYIALTGRKFAYTPEDCDEYLASVRRKDNPCQFVKTPAPRITNTTSRGTGKGFMARQASRRAAMQTASKAN